MNKTPVKAPRKYNSTNYNQPSPPDESSYKINLDFDKQNTRFPNINFKNSSSSNLLSSINGGFKDKTQQAYRIQNYKYSNTIKQGGNSFLAESSKIIFSHPPKNKKSSSTIDESTNEELASSSASFHNNQKQNSADYHCKQAALNKNKTNGYSLNNLFNKINNSNCESTVKESNDVSNKIDVTIYANSPFIVRDSISKRTKPIKGVEDFYLNSPMKSFKQPNNYLTKSAQEHITKVDEKKSAEVTIESKSVRALFNIGISD